MIGTTARNADLGVRSLSAIVMLAIAGGALWLGGWWWNALAALIGLGVIREWVSLVHGFVKPPAVRGLWNAAGIVYIAGAVGTLIFLRVPEDGIYRVGQVLLAVMGVDIGAYAAGRLIGGPKIAPSISPSKTWAGLFGGIVGAALLLGLVSWAWLTGLCDAYTSAFDQPAKTGVFQFDGPCSFGVGPLWYHATSSTVAGVIVAVVAQAGDFFESWMKRRAGVKDSGNLIPGHGGLFDRVDGLLAVCSLIGLVSLILDVSG